MPRSLVLVFLCHEEIWGSGGITPPFLTSALDRGGCSCLTHQPLQPQNLWYPLDRRLVRPQSQSGCCGEEKNITSQKSNPGCPACSPAQSSRFHIILVKGDTNLSSYKNVDFFKKTIFGSWVPSLVLNETALPVPYSITSDKLNETQIPPVQEEIKDLLIFRHHAMMGGGGYRSLHSQPSWEWSELLGSHPGCVTYGKEPPVPLDSMPGVS
jgi:hypothetical protein